jgi:hypothetical protein
MIALLGINHHLLILRAILPALEVVDTLPHFSRTPVSLCNRYWPLDSGNCMAFVAIATITAQRKKKNIVDAHYSSLRQDYRAGSWEWQKYRVTSCWGSSYYVKKCS